MAKDFDNGVDDYKVGNYSRLMREEEERDTYEQVYHVQYYGPDDHDDYDDEFDDDTDDGEYMDIYEARELYIGSGMDEDYTFGYTEDELDDRYKD